MEIRTKIVLNSVIVKDMDDKSGYRFRSIITTDSSDRSNEMILPLGMNITRYMEQSGNVFYNHDYTTMPIAHLDKTRTVRKDQKTIEMSACFLKKPEGHQGNWFPDEVRSFVNQFSEAGFNVGVSVGFKPLETRNPTKQDRNLCYENCIAKGMSAEEAKQKSMDLDTVISKSELLEFSVCPLQCNTDAMVISVGKGLITPETIKFAGYTLPPTLNETRQKLEPPEVKDIPELEIEDTGATHPNCKCSVEDNIWYTQKDACDICLEAKKDFNAMSEEDRAFVVGEMFNDLDEKNTEDIHLKFSKAKGKIPKKSDKKVLHSVLFAFPKKGFKDTFSIEVKKALYKSWGKNYVN